MSVRGLYQPKIADEHIRRLYHLAKECGLKMTQLVNLIIAVAIEEIERGGDHKGSIELAVENSERGRIYGRVVTAHVDPDKPKSKKHERARFCQSHAVCQRDKRPKV